MIKFNPEKFLNAATSQDPKRYVLQYVHNDGTYAVATCGKWLHVCPSEHAEGVGSKCNGYPNWRQVVPEEFNHSETVYVDWSTYDWKALFTATKAKAEDANKYLYAYKGKANRLQVSENFSSYMPCVQVCRLWVNAYALFNAVGGNSEFRAEVKECGLRGPVRITVPGWPEGVFAVIMPYRDGVRI